MKNLIALFFLLLFVGCGKEYVHTVTELPVEVEKEVRVAQDFEGVYFFENGGFLELVASVDGEVSILREGYALTSINPKNGTLATHPVVIKENLEPSDNKLFFSKNVNYGNHNRYDLEEDESGSNITGSRRTDYTITLLEDGNIKVIVKVYKNKISHNINEVVAVREFLSY